MGINKCIVANEETDFSKVKQVFCILDSSSVLTQIADLIKLEKKVKEIVIWI